MSAPALIRGFEVVIGLETHAQLATRSKIFSGASTQFCAAPNTQACAVDLALPGTLPVLNRAAVELAIRFGLAVDATVAPLSIFARKNYFYHDLSKGYQISQYEIPVVQGGYADQLAQKDMLVQEAQRRADQIVSQAPAEAQATRADADNYVVDTLMQLQDPIAKLSGQVSNGIRMVQEDQMRKSSNIPEKAE